MKRSNSNELVAALSKRPSSSSSIMDDDIDDTELPQSLFVVVSYSHKAPFFSSIVQLGTQVNNHAHNKSRKKTPVTLDGKVFSAHFRQPQVDLRIDWSFSPLASCTEDLYMVPDCGCVTDDDVRLHGYKFNLRTNEFKRIQHPLSSKIYGGNVLSLRDHIYFMPRDGWICDARRRRRRPTDDEAHPIFERYNPLKDSWEPRKPFPVKSVHRRNGDIGKIVATALWDDTILMNIDRCKIWAYNGGRDEWYIVNVEDEVCYCIVGEAVVVENTIYGLTREPSETILALSIRKEEINGDLVYTCSLRSEISVPGMLKIKFEEEDAHWMTRHLVHLGKDNFCLVRSCSLYGLNTCQPIQVTYMKLRGQNKMTVTKICVHEMEIMNSEQFEVRLCFSLPDCKTTPLKQGNKPDVFDFNPFSEDFDPQDYADSEPEDGPRKGPRKRSPSPPWI